MGKTVTKAEMAAELDVLRRHCDELSTKCDVLALENDELRSQVARLKAAPANKADGMGLVTSSPSERVRVLPQRSRIVHEFDPDLPGDYLRAMQRARELGGVVRRKQ